MPVSRTAAAPVARFPLSLSVVVCFSSRLVSSHTRCVLVCARVRRGAARVFTVHWAPAGRAIGLPPAAPASESAPLEYLRLVCRRKAPLTNKHTSYAHSHSLTLGHAHSLGDTHIHTYTHSSSYTGFHTHDIVFGITSNRFESLHSRALEAARVETAHTRTST